MSNPFFIELIQSVGVPTAMLAAFAGAAWKYVVYQNKREEKREELNEQRRKEQEDRIRELVNGDRKLLINTISDVNQTRNNVADSLRELSHVIRQMPCVVNPTFFEKQCKDRIDA